DVQACRRAGNDAVSAGGGDDPRGRHGPRSRRVAGRPGRAGQRLRRAALGRRPGPARHALLERLLPARAPAGGTTAQRRVPGRRADGAVPDGARVLRAHADRGRGRAGLPGNVPQPREVTRTMSDWSWVEANMKEWQERGDEERMRLPGFYSDAFQFRETDP